MITEYDIGMGCKVKTLETSDRSLSIIFQLMAQDVRRTLASFL